MKRTAKNFKFIFFMIFFTSSLYGQLERIGGGLAFSSGLDYNTIETGNPGVFGKVYVKLLKKTYLVPSVSVFNRYHRSTVTQSFINYMFQGDADFQYEFFKEGPLRVVGFAGANVTGIISRYEVFIGEPRYSDQEGFKPGLNLGAGVEMYINKNLDSVLSTKYIAGSWDQFMIQLSLIYHPYGRKRIGW